MKNNKILTTGILALTAALFLASCSKSTKSAAFETEAMTDEDYGSGAFQTSGVTASAKRSVQSAAVPEAPLPAPTETSIERKLIRRGNLTIEVDSLEKTLTSVESWVKSYGGYIENSSEWRNGLNITAKIPSARFDSAMGEASGFGRLRSKNVNSTDVTEQYYDLDTRLSTKRVMLKRLNAYLAQAKDIKDMIEIESKINEVTSDLEAMQGQMNRLSNQIDFAEIKINAQLPANQNESGFELPDAGADFRRFAYNMLKFFVSFFITLLYIVVFGTPIALAVLLFYWLCFGKVGILRKLFQKARGKKD